jgi:hypothetical protein
MNITISFHFLKKAIKKKHPPIVATTKQLIETRFAQTRRNPKREVITTSKQLKLRVWFKKTKR